MRALRLLTRVLIVATVVILIISVYNVAVFFGGLLSPEAGIGFNLIQTPGTGDYVISLSVNPTNPGFLGVDLSTRLTLFDADGKVVESNSTFVSIPPGQSRSSYISVMIPGTMVPEGNLQNVKGSAQIELDVRTLWNLVGFKNVLRAGSGQG